MILGLEGWEHLETDYPIQKKSTFPRLELSQTELEWEKKIGRSPGREMGSICHSWYRGMGTTEINLSLREFQAYATPFLYAAVL